MADKLTYEELEEKIELLEQTISAKNEKIHKLVVQVSDLLELKHELYLIIGELENKQQNPILEVEDNEG